MRTNIIILLCVFSVVTLAVAKPNPVTKSITKEQFVICPVAGTKITPATAYEKTVFKGKTYYFCCAGCKPMFQKDPGKYLKNTATEKQPMKMMPKH
ncbi:MAG: YHS domain-containing protein [Candidatus Margulisiibacteriota bacterium]|jgi:Cu+-exporting ATPase